MLSVSFYSVKMFLSMYTGKGMQEPLVCKFAISILLAKGMLRCGNYLLDCAHCEPSDIALMKDLS